MNAFSLNLNNQSQQSNLRRQLPAIAADGTMSRRPDATPIPLAVDAILLRPRERLHARNRRYFSAARVCRDGENLLRKCFNKVRHASACTLLVLFDRRRGVEGARVSSMISVFARRAIA
jgi:hypothetical protein